MKKPYTFISKDKDNLIEMLNLRKSGWTFVALSQLYDCDRTTLRYQCRKYQVFPIKKLHIKNSSEVFDPKRIALHIIHELYPTVQTNWTIIQGEKINKGKSYAEYLAERSLS